MNIQMTYTAFLDEQCLVNGTLVDVATAIQQHANQSNATLLIFNDQTGKQIDLDISGSKQDIQQRYAEPEMVKKVGRPKLGVISREITLQQKHWDWLDQQSSSASAVIRKLIDNELNNPNSESNKMLAKQATDRFMSAMLGNMPNYEEATRALYQGNKEVFLDLIRDYSKDIYQHILKLSAYAF